MLQDQPMNNGGDEEGVDETTLIQDNVEETESGVDETTHTESDTKSTAQLDEERRRAITASIEKSKEAESARAESSFLKAALKASKDPNTIIDLYREDPILAERIAQENWGRSYQEAYQILTEQTKQTPATPSPTEDFRKVYREEREREMQQSERQRMSKLEVDFFLERNIDPKSAVFKQIMTTYQKFKPTSYDEAQELLEMAQAKATRTTNKTSAGDIDAVPTIKGSTAASMKKKPTALSATALALGKKLGLTDKYLN